MTDIEQEAMILSGIETKRSIIENGFKNLPVHCWGGTDVLGKYEDFGKATCIVYFDVKRGVITSFEYLTEQCQWKIIELC